jgi:uncharacterized protein RhaS with RHS repeats
MNGRVQDPLIGRFLSPDPLVPDPFDGQSFNRYSYVRNNPLSRVDPTGFDDGFCPIPCVDVGFGGGGFGGSAGGIAPPAYGTGALTFPIKMGRDVESENARSSSRSEKKSIGFCFSWRPFFRGKA